MIEEIIQNELIEIYFQPIVSIRTKNVYAFEALCRCSYNGQNLPPDILFKLAKDKGLLLQLDILARKKAIQKFKAYYKENKDLLLFLNFESSLINNNDSLSSISSFLETIAECEIPFLNFVLEIKEDEITNGKALKKFCTTYKELGFFIALDDFGTGSSTFDRINLIRPDIIKIDKSLFDNLENNQINKEIVKAIAKMSHNLGIRVLAEGVEDEDSICIGMKSTINLFQGYYFCKPLSQIDDNIKKEIIDKTIEIGKSFKIRNINSINKKRMAIDRYDLISKDIISNIEELDTTYNVFRKSFNKLEDVEAIFLIDTTTGKQIHDTIITKNTNERFKPTKNGDEHFLKEYFYITLESRKGIFLSQKYISYATGSLCKTFAKKFSINNKSYILCMDIVIEKG